MNIRSAFGLVILMVSTQGCSAGDAAVEAARQDLAKRLELPVQQVTVVSREEKEWPDASIGCPIPGMRYAQVVTNGSELILSAQGQRYSYHARAGRAYLLCSHKPKKSGAPQTGAPRHDT